MNVPKRKIVVLQSIVKSMTKEKATKLLLKGSSFASEYISAGADVNACNEYLESALIVYIKNSHFGDIIRQLLSAGANPNARDRFNIPALALATYVCNLDIIKMLVDAGADQTSKNIALRWATMYLPKRVDEWSYHVVGDDNNEDTDAPAPAPATIQKEIADYLCEQGACACEVADEPSPMELLHACHAGNIACVKELLTAASVNYSMMSNDTFFHEFIGVQPIHIAAKTGNVELLVLLIAANANVDAVSSNEQRPVELAILNNHPVSLAILLKAGASIKYNCELPALGIAAMKGSLECTALLIKEGADVESIFKYYADDLINPEQYRYSLMTDEEINNKIQATHACLDLMHGASDGVHGASL